MLFHIQENLNLGTDYQWWVRCLFCIQTNKQKSKLFSFLLAICSILCHKFFQELMSKAWGESWEVSRPTVAAAHDITYRSGEMKAGILLVFLCRTHNESDYLNELRKVSNNSGWKAKSMPRLFMVNSWSRGKDSLFLNAISFHSDAIKWQLPFLNF